MNNQFKMMQMQ
jgi:hypothetical protein